MTPDLATRVEGLEGASREVDAEIALLQGLRVVDEGHPLGRVCYDAAGRSVLLPRYTHSLDAAMTLVPAGWWLEIEQHSTCWTATLATHLWYDERRTTQDGEGATPALALTAAALRATTVGRAG